MEKHRKFALYYPNAEAISSMIYDLPSKILTAVAFNTTLYFMANLRHSPGPFFFFLFASFLATLTMSSIFRTIAAGSETIVGALAPTAIFMLGLIIYTGFTIPTSYMKPWFWWINFIYLIGYMFESLMINEFHGREFPCAVNAFVPAGIGYANVTGLERACGVVGARPGSSSVLGDTLMSLVSW